MLTPIFQLSFESSAIRVSSIYTRFVLTVHEGGDAAAASFLQYYLFISSKSYDPASQFHNYVFHLEFVLLLSYFLSIDLIFSPRHLHLPLIHSRNRSPAQPPNLPRISLAVRTNYISRLSSASKSPPQDLNLESIHI